MLRCFLSSKRFIHFFIYIGIAIFSCHASTTNAEVIGYYNLSNPSDTDAANSITLAGHQPVQLGGLSSSDLSGIDVLWVLNPSNGNYAAELSGNLSSISDFISGGGVLMFHDRYVTDAALVIPGAADVLFVRDFSDDASIELGPGATGSLLDGPGGIIDADSLDGGNSSSHGYAVASSLPAGSVVVLTRTDNTQAVDFYYSLGGGKVYYSTIPLDFYLNYTPGTSAVADNFQAYTTNLAAYIFEIIGPSLSPIQFQHIAMADSARYENELLQKHMGKAHKGFFAEAANFGAERGESGSEEEFHSWDTSILAGYNGGNINNINWGAALTLHSASNKSQFDSSVQGEYATYGIKAFSRIDLPALRGVTPWLDFIGGVSAIDDVDLERNDNSGTTDGYQYDLGMRLGTAISLTEGVMFTPAVGLEHVSTHLDDYEENGVGAMSYSSLDSHATYALLSCTLGFKELDMGALKIRPSFLAEYRSRLEKELDDMNVSLTSSPDATSSTELFDYNTNIAKFALQLNMDYGIANINLHGSYYRGNDDMNGTGVSMALSIPF